MSKSTPMNASRVGVEVWPLTEGEFANLQPGDTIHIINVPGDAWTVIGRDPFHPVQPAWVLNQPEAVSPQVAAREYLWFPIGETLSRLRPEPREIREGQTWRNDEGEPRIVGALDDTCWKIFDAKGCLCNICTEEDLREGYAFVSEPAAPARIPLTLADLPNLRMDERLYFRDTDAIWAVTAQRGPEAWQIKRDGFGVPSLIFSGNCGQFSRVQEVD